MIIIPTTHFLASAKSLAKKYRSFNSDYQIFLKEIEENPNLGDDLGSNLRKIRVAISSKGKGKSGGARFIIFDAIAVADTIYLIYAYDKSQASNIKINVIKDYLHDLGLDSMTTLPK